MTNEKIKQTVAEIIQIDLVKQIAQKIHVKIMQIMQTDQIKQTIQTTKMIQVIQQQD